MPTRAQIEAAYAQPTFAMQWYVSGAWTSISNGYIISINGSQSSTINQENPIGFGDASQSECTIVVGSDFPSSLEWQLTPVRIYLGYEGSNDLYYTGVITGRSRDDYTITFTCGGFNEKIGNTAAYSKLFFNRPAATATTIASVEDPSNVAYQAGIINYIFWKSGGRPAEQDFAYPNAQFYYSCDASMFRVYAAWVAGEDIWEEALKLARAAGGQIFQDVDGVMKYRNPLSYGRGTATYTFDEGTYATISEEQATAQLVGEVRCNYTPRFIGPLQQVYQDETPLLVEAGSSITITAETEWPLYRFILDPSATQLPDKEDTIIAAFFDGAKVVSGAGGYTLTIADESAQRIILTLTNNTSKPFVVYKVTLYGEPVLAGDQKSYTFGSGDPQKILEDNVYVQNAAHAERLCRMVKDFYGTARSLRKLGGCGFDPDRYIGELVYLTNTSWGISAQIHRIVDISHNDTGTLMDVSLVPVDGLPTDTTFFIVDQTYADADVRQLSY